MKTAVFTAAALFAAPVCMVAQAADVNVFVNETIALVNNLSDILNRVTPENAERMDAEILALKPQADELKKMAEGMSEDLESNPEIIAKITNAMMSLFTSMGKLQAAMENENTTPEQKTAIRMLVMAIDSVMSDGDNEQHDDEEDES